MQQELRFISVKSRSLDTTRFRHFEIFQGPVSQFERKNAVVSRSLDSLGILRNFLGPVSQSEKETTVVPRSLEWKKHFRRFEKFFPRDQFPKLKRKRYLYKTALDILKFFRDQFPNLKEKTRLYRDP